MDGSEQTPPAASFSSAPRFFYGPLMAQMPVLKARAALSESDIGRLLLAPGFSAVLMIAASSRLVARFGSRRILAAGVLSAAAGLVRAAGAADCWCVAAAFVLFGLGEGLWDVAVNVQAMSGQRRWNLRVMLIMHALYKCRKCDRCRRDFTDFVLLVLTPGSLTMQLRMRQKRGPKDVSSLRRLSGSSGSWRSALMQRKVHRPSGGALLLMTKGAGLDAAAPAFAAFAAAAALSAVSSASSCGGASQRVC